MKRWLSFAFLLVACASLSAAQPATAQTNLVSTLANTDVHGDLLDPTGVWLAQSFTTDAATHTLHSIDAALTSYEGGVPANVVAKLYSANASNGNMGSAIRTLGAASSQGGDVYRFSNTGAALNLAASTKYWIVMSYSSSNFSEGVWFRYGDSLTKTGPGTIPTNKAVAVSFNSGGSWMYGALGTGTFDYRPYRFQVNVDGRASSAVPEPGALALFLPALGAIAVLRRRR